MSNKIQKQPASRRDFLGHLILTAPLFLTYHLGLLVSPRAANGADPFTRTMGSLAGLSRLGYLAIMLILIFAYSTWVKRLARHKKFDARRFPLVLLESAAYALVMGPLAGLLLSKLHLLGGALVAMGPVDRVIASAGAGFYEELIFRVAGIALIVWLLGLRKKKLSTRPTMIIAVVLSSLVFSVAHYLGPGADSFGLASFSFRFVLGCMLAAIYLLRGFATAAYAHFFYDIYVLLFLLP
jgi:hypothetical protein